MQHLQYHPGTARRVAHGNVELASAMQPMLFVSVASLRTRAQRCVRRDNIRACSSRVNGGVQAVSTVYAVATRRVALRLIAGLCGASACGAYAAERALAPRLYESVTEVTTAEGLRYFDLAVGAGAEVAEGSTVLLHYTSRLGGLNGIKLDSSRDGQGGGEPYRFVVGDTDAVPGFDRALRGMHVGGKRRVLCPPALAYSSPVQKPPVREFFAKRRLLSVINTNRDASIVFE